jgi:release factor glutamine methyltransferase
VRGASVRDALQGAETAIAASGSATPRLDAELLLAEALGVERARLYVDDLAVEGQAVRRYQELVRRRAVERAPVAYLVGRRGFRHLELEVDRRVLIPRPETEHAVEAVVELAPEGARVVDVGTGSGAIALAVADERPDLRVTGSDVSADALAVARANGERLGLGVEWVQADLVPPGQWDLVVSNPPYVAEGEALPPDVAGHEPGMALWAGPDGLDVLRRLVAERPPLLVVVLGAGLGPAVLALARDAGFARAEARRDLAGIERIVVACA